MYWEEREMEGVLHYRTTPDGEWIAYTPEQLTVIIKTYKDAYGKLREVIEKEVA